MDHSIPLFLSFTTTMTMFSRSVRLVQSSSRPLLRRAADKQGKKEIGHSIP